jgi:YegS/Rv2252/BmrU family lipid kinase
MKTFFVVNPQSANGSTGKRWGSYAAVIAQRLHDFAVEFTRGPGDATALARRALLNGYECVVAVGGDGTINEVVNGFFVDDQVVNANAALGVLPRGTGGDFRRSFEWSTDFAAAVERLKTNETRPFDVGQVDYQTHQGQSARRFFANVCSFGVSGVVDEEVARTTKALGGKASFMLGSARALLRYRDRTVRLVVDGQPLPPQPITTVACGNGQYFGGGMKVTPNADTSDGWLDVTVWAGFGLADFVVKNAALYNGRHVHLPGTQTFRCRTLEATADSEVLIDCDGEQPGRLPCTVTLRPSAIRLKV